MHRLLPLLSLLFALPSLLRAQDSLTFRPAIANGQRLEQRELLPAQRLEGDALRQLSGGSIADALRQFSGLQMKDYGGVGGLKTVNVRGMGTHHVGVFFDGIALNNAQNGQIDLGRFSLDEMDALTLYNAQRSRLLQSAKDFAAASSLYLESRAPSFLDRNDHLRARLRYSSFATFNPSLTYERRLSKSLSTSLSTEWMRTSGRYSFRYLTAGGYHTTATRRNGDVRAQRAEWGLFGTTPQGAWRTKAYLYTSARGLPGAVVRNRFSHEDRQWDTQLFLQSSFRHRLSARHALLVNAKWGYDYLHYLSDPSQGDLSAMYTDNTYRRQEAYLSLAQEWQASPRLSASLAVDYGYDHLHANLYRFAFPTRHTLLVATAARYTLWGAELQGSLLYAFIGESVRTGEAPSRRHLSPSLSLSVPIRTVEGLTLRAFYKDVFRMPTLNELYYTLVGRSDLRPETAQQFDLGLSFARRGWELRLDAYYNKVRHKIVAMPTSNMFRWTMLNLGRVSIRGVEAVAAKRWTMGALACDLRATYTFERAIDTSSPSDAYYRHQIPYIPRHSGSLMAGVAWQAWAVHYSFIYTGERYDQRANLPENFAPAWYTSDLSLTYRRRHWMLTAQMSNLFNQRYEIVKGYPLPGTNFRATLAIEW